MSENFTRKEISSLLGGLTARVGFLVLVWWASPEAGESRLDLPTMFIGAFAWSCGAYGHAKTEQSRGE